MKSKIKQLILIFLLMVISCPAVCCADNSPMDHVKKNFDKIVLMLQSDSFINKSEKGQQKEMYENSISNFDFKVISMLVLGRNWKRFSSSQKDDFIKYFSRLLANIYLSKIRGDKFGKIKVDYLKTIYLKTKSKRADVYTVLHYNVETPVVYRMIKKKSAPWKVYDILIEGVSLVANFRETYKEKILEPPEKIISELRRKLEE